MRHTWKLLTVLALAAGLPARAQYESLAPPTSGLTQKSASDMSLNLKLGGYFPYVDSSPGLNGTHPYVATFGLSSMLLFSAELDKLVWQGIGSAGLGFSVGYAEKWAQAYYLSTGAPAPQKTGFMVLPLEVLALYRMDYPALHWGIPFVPYVKAGVIYEPWWTSKGGATENVSGISGQGGRLGYGLTGGMAFALDVLEPRLSSDAFADLGIHHTYLFAEFDDNVVTGVSQGMDLSSHTWMFGLAFDF